VGDDGDVDDVELAGVPGEGIADEPPVATRPPRLHGPITLYA
jgi:hypothetical protein